MKSEEVYNAWKQRKSNIEVSSSFSDKVMGQIHKYEQTKQEPFFSIQRLIEVVSAHTLTKVALVAAGAATGLVRLLFGIIMILGRGDING